MNGEFIQDWSLFTNPEDFWRALESMEERIALGQGDQRGSYTYMDMHTLSRNASFRRTMLTVLQEILKVK